MAVEKTLPKPYAIDCVDDRSMFGKKTGKVNANLTGRYGSTIATVQGTSAADARAEMMKQIAETIDESRPSYVICGDGKTTIVVFRTIGGWEYEIIGADRTVPSGCLMSVSTRKDAIAQAIAHADQSYSGTVQILRGAY